MSDEKRDLTGENVHGIKYGVNWTKWKSWDEKPAKKEKPKVAEPEPVAEEPAPAPEPEPAPAKGEDWVSGTALNNMADHLRRAKRLKITIEQAKQLILNDEATKITYQNHQKRGKF
jgi:hypothetical protein